MLRSREVADDVVQEVFLAVWRRPEGVSAACLTRGYLYGAVRNTVLWRLRDARVAERFVGDVDSALYERDRDRTVAEDAEQRELVQAARRAIARLPGRCALVFVLSREHGLTYPEIAEALGISVKTVETQIGRAIRSLRLALTAYLSMIVLVGSR
jgi:RNA polymerase sigma-70 factor (ECF subfamily)